jgi:hypothetical protein
MNIGNVACPPGKSERLIADMNYYTEMNAVNSSAIRAVGYGGHTLAVQFHANSATYCHLGVPYSLYGEFMRASSMGAFHSRHIHRKYQRGLKI